MLRRTFGSGQKVAVAEREVIRLHAVVAFGERAILWKCPRTASVQCVRPVVCAQLSRETFLEVHSPRVKLLLHNLIFIRPPVQVLSPRAKLLLQSALPPPGTGDLPPLCRYRQQHALGRLCDLGTLGKGTYGLVRVCDHSYI